MHTGMVFLSFVVLLVIAAAWNLRSGSVSIPIGEIAEILSGRGDPDSTAYSVIWKIRLPRMILGAVLGGALSLSGFLIQTFFRNPIAGPFVLGISSGAKMFLAFATIAVSGLFADMPVSATVAASFAGSVLSLLIVILFTGRVRNMSSLLVIGMMISYICSAVTDLLINFANDSDIINLTHWSMGSFSAASWQSAKISTIIVIPAFFVVLAFSKQMEAYSLGEGYAMSLGVDIKALRVLLVLLTGVLSASVAAFAGPISFVGIAVPHICRMLLKTEKPILMIPASFLCGAVFCMLCDLAARMLFSPTELSISTVTSAVGAPIVIWLMLTRRNRNGG
ncbi:MAG: iron ABC transporter permease [Oscillospiraceae bacterium]|nr:iron ABC transporter permease [Oscillospiraceae bacterium]MBQ4000722.1 iron ABC transporter permease [Oscillospiraceae bacterium]MBQ4239906.1 iron ABC transporter permease [Oscillospiraceae bacterium]